MAVVVPTVTPTTTTEYREQLDRLVPFATRVHLDFMDGQFVEAKSPTMKEISWPPGEIQVDAHLMYKRPIDQIEAVLQLRPSLIIIHAEAENVYEFLSHIATTHIKKGVALLQDTSIDAIKPLMGVIDHVLVFSGHLGHFGGQADLTLLNKVQAIKAFDPRLEVAWDGGINDRNAQILARGGVDVLNVGGFIQKGADPANAYATLKALVEP